MARTVIPDKKESLPTSARNFLDHEVLGDSGIFVPLTDLAEHSHYLAGWENL